MAKTVKIRFVFALVGITWPFPHRVTAGGRMGVTSNVPDGLVWRRKYPVHGGGRHSAKNSRSDTMILACIDKQASKVVLIWIPRDTRIEVSKGVTTRSTVSMP